MSTSTTTCHGAECGITTGDEVALVPGDIEGTVIDVGGPTAHWLTVRLRASRSVAHLPCDRARPSIRA